MNFSTVFGIVRNRVESHLSKHTGTKGCSDNWISETINYCFPFNAQHNTVIWT